MRPQATDLAVLESEAPRADFLCKVTPEKPYLGFDLRLHADYGVTVPLKILADTGSRLQVLMRVIPAANRKSPVYLVQQFVAPNTPPKAKGEWLLRGGVDLGYGRYQVDWMMRDAGGRACSFHWELVVKPRRHERNLPLTLKQSTVAQRMENADDDKPPVERAAQSLHVKILLNLSPAKPQEIALEPEDASVLFSILRGITRQLGVNRFSLVAFDMREQRIVARQDGAEDIDFATVYRALTTHTNGTVNYHLLQDPHSEMHFVTKLLTDQLGTQTVSPDAIIIVGPKVALEKKVSLGLLKQGGAVSCPIFYLKYNPNPIDEPFADTIGCALKAYKGASEFQIVFPRDVGAAMKEILSSFGKLPRPAG